VKITPEGNAKVLDFGLAKVAAADAAEPDVSHSPTVTTFGTLHGVILGTAAYMSPEQARGRPIDRRTDVWAFGCLLYEMLTGRRAFHGDTASDIIVAILDREPDWGRLPESTPAGVRNLLRRCLRKEPGQRLHDIADARIEIEEVLAGRSVAAETADVPARSRRAGRAAAISWALVGLAIGATIAGLLVARSAPPVPTGPRASPHFDIVIPETTPIVSVPSNSCAALSPDGTLLVFTGSREVTVKHGLADDVSRQTQLFLRRFDRFDCVPIEGTKNGFAPFFSPDGQWIGYLDGSNGRLKKVPLRGGAPVTLCDASSDFRSASWGDDDRIYFAPATTGIRVVSSEGGIPEDLTVPDRERSEKTHRFPHVLPGSRGVLFTLGSSKITTYDDASVALLSLETGKYRVLVEGGTHPRYVPTGHIVYARAGGLLAVPFDVKTLEVTGTPYQVLDGVVTSDGFGGAHFSVSENGTLVYLPGGPEHYHAGVYLLDRNGEVQPLPLPSRTYATARFSPDGRRIALSVFGANASIWIYELARQTVTRLTTDWDNYGAIWSRTGNSVTFPSNRGGIEGLWRMPADGNSPAELLLEAPGNATSWSSGDRLLAYSEYSASTGDDIWVWAPDGDRRSSPLLESPFRESDGTFSPNDRWLAYVSDESGREQVYARRVSGGGERRQISVDGGHSPRWGSDGRELFYRKGSALIVVPVTMEPDLVLGKPRNLLETQFSDVGDYDVAPDGQHFVAIASRDEESASPSATSGSTSRSGAASPLPAFRVIVNWFEELRRGGS